jgi:hypothetical protein
LLFFLAHREHLRGFTRSHPRLPDQLARDLREQIVGVFLFRQRPAEQLRDVRPSDLSGERPGGPVSGDLVVFDLLLSNDRPAAAFGRRQPTTRVAAHGSGLGAHVRTPPKP